MLDADDDDVAIRQLARGREDVVGRGGLCLAVGQSRDLDSDREHLGRDVSLPLLGKLRLKRSAARSTVGSGR